MINTKAWLNTLSVKSWSLPVVIFYVTEGCNLKCVTCSYREAFPNELSLSEISGLAKTLDDFGLRHIVYSGGEPLVRRDFREICEIFRRYNVKQTLLTNGLLLEKRSDELQNYFNEIIVSLDGADREIHNAIRGINSFDQIILGIKRIVHSGQSQRISIRTVLQKQNYHQVMDMVVLAKSLGVSRISFLAADILSDGFGRDTRGAVVPNESIMLDNEETANFRHLVEQMISFYNPEFENGFIAESPDKMFHIAQYFEALNGKRQYPRNHCNAPDVSAVITSTGDLKPCFFLPAFGNIRQNSLRDLVNNATIKETRKRVRKYTLERCHTCVCTIKARPTS